MKVVYGHTDSIYVKIDTIENAQKLLSSLNNSLVEIFPNVLDLEPYPVVLEFEKYYSSLGVGTVKNRNAGLIVWENGDWIEPKFTMTGFTAKRVSITPFEKEIQTHILRMWVDNKPLSEINSYLHNKYDSVLNGKIDINSLIKRSRLKNERLTVKCPSCKRYYILKDLLNYSVCGEHEGREGSHKCGYLVADFTSLDGKRPSISSGIAGVLYCLQKTNMKFDDSYLYMKVGKTNETFIHPLTKEVRKIEYVAGNILQDFDNYIPDWEYYAEQVIKMAKPIYSAMGWDITNIRGGKIQKSLEEWF